jgi:hypothetical protein
MFCATYFIETLSNGNEKKGHRLFKKKLFTIEHVLFQILPSNLKTSRNMIFISFASLLT